MQRMVRGIKARGFDQGALWLVLFLGMGYAAAEAWWGAAVMLALFGPMWLSGAWYAGKR